VAVLQTNKQVNGSQTTFHISNPAFESHRDEICTWHLTLEYHGLGAWEHLFQRHKLRCARKIDFFLRCEWGVVGVGVNPPDSFLTPQHPSLSIHESLSCTLLQHSTSTALLTSYTHNQRTLVYWVCAGTTRVGVLLVASLDSLIKQSGARRRKVFPRCCAPLGLPAGFRKQFFIVSQSLYIKKICTGKGFFLRKTRRKTRRHTRCSVLQCVTVRDSVLKRVAMCCNELLCCSAWHCVVVRCCTRATMCCGVQQCESQCVTV